MRWSNEMAICRDVQPDRLLLSTAWNTTLATDLFLARHNPLTSLTRSPPGPSGLSLTWLLTNVTVYCSYLYQATPKSSPFSFTTMTAESTSLTPQKKKRVSISEQPIPDTKTFQVQRRRVWRACESCRYALSLSWLP